MTHVRLIHVDKLTFHVGPLGKKIHYQQVHIAIFEHVRQLRVEKPELVIVCIVRNLNNKHRQSPLALYSLKGQFPCQHTVRWASELLKPVWMFVTDFFFSSFFVAFAGILMVGGIVLLGDAIRRIVRELYKSL